MEEVLLITLMTQQNVKYVSVNLRGDRSDFFVKKFYFMFYQV